MIAWHGSPVLFDHFEASRIEAGQSEGFGCYVTEYRHIACQYAKPGVWRRAGTARNGYVYEVQAPDGEYMDNSRPIAEQPEEVRAIMSEAVDRLSGPMAGYWRFVVADTVSYTDWSQVGRALFFARKSGNPVEPSLIAAGFVGCQYTTGEMNEYAIFDPASITIRSIERVN